MKVIGRSSSLEGITKIINRYWPSSGYTLEPLTDTTWQPVSERGTRPEGFHVVHNEYGYQFVSV